MCLCSGGLGWRGESLICFAVQDVRSMKNICKCLAKHVCIFKLYFINQFCAWKALHFSSNGRKRSICGHERPIFKKKEEKQMLENYCTNFLLPSLCAELLLFQDESAVKTTIAVSEPFTSSCQRKEKC